MQKQFIISAGAWKGLEFSELQPPSWLYGGHPGSTMDNRWFYNDHVLTLKVGQEISTDFNTIKRVS